MSKPRDVAGVNLAEPSPGDLERVVTAYTETRAKLSVAVSALIVIETELRKKLDVPDEIEYEKLHDWCSRVARAALEKLK